MSGRSSDPHLAGLSAQGWDGCAFAEENNELQRQFDMGKNLSVKEIAEMAGTSVATVSRVINQNGRFSKDTEKKVLDIIEQYNYQPNQLARSLRVNHTQIIGIMVPDITNEFFANIVRTVQKYLLEQNYMTIICNANENGIEAQKQLQMLLAQKVSGLIYINSGADDVAEFPDIPTVYIDRDPRETQIKPAQNYAMIECDNIQGGYLAGQELVKKGARKIAYVCFNSTLSTIKKRIQGFEEALREAGIPFDPACGFSVNEVTATEGFRITQHITQQFPDVDGIFFMSDVLALGGLGYLVRSGIPVPERIRVVGFDDISISANICPSLTTVHQPVEEFGRLAALRIVDMINGKGDIWQQRQRIPVELIVRETT